MKSPNSYIVYVAPLREQGLWISLLPVYVFKPVVFCAQLVEMFREAFVAIHPPPKNFR